MTLPARPKPGEVGLHQLFIEEPGAAEILDRKAARSRADDLVRAVEADADLSAAIAAHRVTVRDMHGPDEVAPPTGAHEPAPDVVVSQPAPSESVSAATPTAPSEPLRTRDAAGHRTDDDRPGRTTERNLVSPLRVAPAPLPAGSSSSFRQNKPLTVIALVTFVTSLVLAVYAVLTALSKDDAKLVRPAATPDATSSAAGPPSADLAPSAKPPLVSPPARDPAEAASTPSPAVSSASPLAGDAPREPHAPPRPPKRDVRAPPAPSTPPGPPAPQPPPQMIE